MTELFSSALKDIIARKKISIAELSRKAFISRQQIYRLKDGQILPTEEDVELLSKALRLSRYEHERMQRAFEVSTQGIEAIEQRELVEKAIKYMNIYNRKPDYEIDANFQPGEIKRLVGRKDIEDAMIYIFKQTNDLAGSEEIFVLMPPSDEFLMHIIASTLSNNKKKSRIVHGFMISGEEYDRISFEYLINVVPLIQINAQNKSHDYEAKYEYSENTARTELYFEPCANIIVTSKHAMLISAQQNHGVFFSSDEIVSYLRYEANRVLRNMQNLCAAYEPDYKYYLQMEQMERESCTAFFTLQLQPSTLFVPVERYSYLFTSSSTQNEGHMQLLELMKRRNNFYSRNIERGIPHYQFFTRTGLNMLQNELRIMDVPVEMLRFSITLKEIQIYLQSIIEMVEKNDSLYLYMMEDDFLGIDREKTIICVMENNSTTFYATPYEPTDVVWASRITEKTFTNAFSQYMLNLATNFRNYGILSREETLKELRNALNHIENQRVLSHGSE